MEQKWAGGLPTRDDLEHYISNKQLAFLHLIYNRILKSGGRAVVVLPDNVLFKGSTGKSVRKDLMEKCNLHTIIRLPTGIFYAAGVKTNVLFFSKPEDVRQDKGNTKNVWVYDLRGNMPQFGKRTLLSKDHFNEFVEIFGDNPTEPNEKARKVFIKRHEKNDKLEECRLRCFTRKEIANKDHSLDLSWMSDDSTEDSANIPEPDILINEAIEKWQEQ